MSDVAVVRYRIEFLSGHTGLGWMEVETATHTVYRIVLDDGTDVTTDGMSYRVVPE